MESPEVTNKYLGQIFCFHCRITSRVVSFFSETVCDDLYAIKVIKFRQRANKVYGDVAPTLGRKRKRLEGSLISGSRDLISYAVMSVFNESVGLLR